MSQEGPSIWEKLVGWIAKLNGLLNPSPGPGKRQIPPATEVGSGEDIPESSETVTISALMAGAPPPPPAQKDKRERPGRLEGAASGTVLRDGGELVGKQGEGQSLKRSEATEGSLGKGKGTAPPDAHTGSPSPAPIETDRFGLGENTLDDLQDAEVAALYQMIGKAMASLNRPAKDKTPRKSGKDRKKAAPSLQPIDERIKKLNQYFDDVGKKNKKHMICLIAYDIEDNKIRTHIADYLMAKGLQRVQLSVFLGEIDRHIFEELYKGLKDIQESYKNEDSILMIPVGESDMRSSKVIGKDIDMEFAIMREHTLFF